MEEYKPTARQLGPNRIELSYWDEHDQEYVHKVFNSNSVSKILELERICRKLAHDRRIK